MLGALALSSQEGGTALMIASYKGHSSVVRVLLKAGSNINTTAQVRYGLFNVGCQDNVWHATADYVASLLCIAYILAGNFIVQNFEEYDFRSQTNDKICEHLGKLRKLHSSKIFCCSMQYKQLFMHPSRVILPVFMSV